EQKAYVEIVDNETGSWGNINVDEIALSNLPAKEKYFPGDHPYFGNLALTVLDSSGFGVSNYNGPGQTISNALQCTKPLGEKLLGATGVSVTLAPGESKDITFLFTWYFPNRPMQYGEGGNWNMPIPT